MRKYFFCSFIFGLIGMGCASSPTQTVWVKTEADEAVYSQDRAICLSQAQEDGKSSADAGLFADCMKKKDWSLQDARKVAAPAASVPKSMQDTFEALKQEKEKRCESMEYKSFFSKTACDPKNVTSAQIADSTKMTLVEKTEAARLNGEMQSAQDQAVASYKEYGGESGERAARLLESWRVFNEKNIADLMDGKQTWGQYNRNRKELYLQLEAELKKI